MNHITFDFDIHKTEKENVEVSISPTHVEKKLSESISKMFDSQYGEIYKRRGIVKVNFDVSIRGEKIVIAKVFAISDCGDVEIFSVGNKHQVIGHILKTPIKEKVKNLAMSIHIPTPLLLFNNEFLSSFKEGFVFKLGIAAFFGSILSLLELTPSMVVNGFMFLLLVVLVDGVLGLLPNTVKGKRAKKDHTLQAKVILFITNMLVLIAFFGVHLFLKQLIVDPNAVQEFFANSIYNIGVAGVIGSYLMRITGYFIAANKSKVPGFVLEFYKKLR